MERSRESVRFDLGAKPLQRSSPAFASRSLSSLSPRGSSRGTRSNSLTDEGDEPAAIVVELLADPRAAAAARVRSRRSLLLLAEMQRAQTALAAPLRSPLPAVSEKTRAELRWKQAELLHALAKTTLKKAPSEMDGPLSPSSVKSLFGVDLAYWTDANVRQKQNVRGTLSPSEVRALELLKMHYFIGGGERITAWIAFRPSEAQLAKAIFAPSAFPVVGLVGVSPTGLGKNPHGIVGFWRQMGNPSEFELYFSLINSVHERPLGNTSGKLPERTMRLYESVDDTLQYQECETLHTVQALPTPIFGVQLQTPDDAIVCTFSVETDATNMFRPQ